MYEQNNIQPSKDKTTKILIALISVMAVAIIILAIVLEKKKNKIVYIEHYNTELSTEKENLRKELTDLYDQYSDLETNNDSLNSEISKQKENISTLISELDRIKNYSYSIKKKYDDEILSLKSIMRSYVYQIDSLDQLNKQLIAENVTIKDKHEQTQKELQQVVEEKEELVSVIEGASTIQTAAITTKFLTAKNKDASKARKIEKLEVDFVLVANQLAAAGTKRIYLRIIAPDSSVLTDGGAFIYREKSIAYTAYRDVSYENNNLPVAIFYNLTEKIAEGNYKIELYLNGDIIGQSAFTIEK
jgi:predicted RNase H-like nuclease (RuvC/YqgF family)